jgi:UPF0716 protein FxsA
MRFFAIFGLIALAEMATFFWVESQIGLLWALGLAIATALIGSYLVRRAGLDVIARFQRRTRQGQVPGRELVDGAAILVSGAFLISPGFITDTLGFLLLIPGVRSLIYRQVSKRFSARMNVFVVDRRPGSSRAEPSWEQGEIIDVDEL